MDIGANELANGISEGWITPAVKPGSLGAPTRFRSPELIVEVLDRDRGE